MNQQENFSPGFAVQETERQTKPGEMLRKAREAKGLSLSEVAKKTRLTREMVEKIEQDNYDPTWRMVFVRGYLRLYAKCVEISQTKVMEAFEALERPSTGTLTEAPIWEATEQQWTTRDKPVKWITFSILLGLIVLVGLWWQSQKNMALDKKAPALVSNANEMDQANQSVPMVTRFNHLPVEKETKEEKHHKTT